MTDRGVDPVEPAKQAERQSLPELFAELAEEGTAWVEAEIAVYSAEARRRLIIAGIGLGLMTLAATLIAGTLIALLVGAMFALGPVVGSGWAIVIVITVALLLAAVAAQAGRMQLGQLTGGRKPGERNARTSQGH